MEQFNNSAHARLRERAYTIWEEAGKDASEVYGVWHRLRPILYRDAPAHTPTAKGMALADEPKPAAARPGKRQG